MYNRVRKYTQECTVLPEYRRRIERIGEGIRRFHEDYLSYLWVPIRGGRVAWAYLAFFIVMKVVRIPMEEGEGTPFGSRPGGKNCLEVCTVRSTFNLGRTLAKKKNLSKLHLLSKVCRFSVLYYCNEKLSMPQSPNCKNEINFANQTSTVCSHRTEMNLGGRILQILSFFQIIH